MSISDSEIRNNLAEQGAGIYAQNHLELSNVTISGNLASEAGGGIYAMGDLTIRNSTVSNNEGLNGGGIFSDGNALSISLDQDTTVERNAATEAGGGVFLCDECNLDSGSILENTADRGAGIYLETPGTSSFAARI